MSSQGALRAAPRRARQVVSCAGNVSWQTQEEESIDLFGTRENHTRESADGAASLSLCDQPLQSYTKKRFWREGQAGKTRRALHLRLTDTHK